MTKGGVASWGGKRVARHFVIPAQAGIQSSASAEAIGYAARWIPACAGMTKVGAMTKGAGEARP
ncbi:hypothetical protein ASE59_13775 [Sphingomonas sp. Leaf10]|nr:hypothetical protein ASE59_13775 [Sphingomonas sp. Leaf10]